MVKMSNVWDRTAEFISDNLGAILPIALLAFFVPASIQGNFAPARDTADAGLNLIFNLVSLGFSILSLWGMLTITAMALDPGAIEDAGKRGRRALLPAILVWLAVLVAFIILALPVPLAMLAAGATFDPAQGFYLSGSVPDSIAWPVGLYSILLVAVLLWAFARLMVVYPVIVREGRMFDALKRSFVLTRGHVWRIIGILILYALLLLVARSAALFVFGSIFELIIEGDGTITLAGVLTSVMVAAVHTGFVVVAPVFQAKLYLALADRERTAASA